LTVTGLRARAEVGLAWPSWPWRPLPHKIRRIDGQRQIRLAFDWRLE
jgi:hypothetical protein